MALTTVKHADLSTLRRFKIWEAVTPRQERRLGRAVTGKGRLDWWRWRPTTGPSPCWTGRQGKSLFTGRPARFRPAAGPVVYRQAREFGAYDDARKVRRPRGDQGALRETRIPASRNPTFLSAQTGSCSRASMTPH